MQLRVSSSTSIMGVRKTSSLTWAFFAGLFCRGWPASGGVVVVVASGGPKPPWRELSPLLLRHARPCGELRNSRPAGWRDNSVYYSV